MRRFFAVSVLGLLTIFWSRGDGFGQANEVAVITVNVTASQPSQVEGMIPKVETINGRPLVKLGIEENGKIVAIAAGTYIFLKFGAASGAVGFEFSPPGIVEPPPGRFHLPKDVIGILRALNPGTAKIVVKTARPRASTGNGNPSGTQSTNWSGYAVTGGPFTKINGQWAVPAVTGDAGSASSSWIGIDGDGNNNLIQVGIEQDWNSGVLGIGEGPSYYAWWEILPAAETKLPNEVHAGDVIYAEITQTDPTTPTTWSIKLSNTTPYWTVTMQVTYTGPASSAEWIEEAPSTCTSSSCTVLPLADYHLVQFEGLTAPASRLTSSDSINMVQGGVTVSSPSDIGCYGFWDVAFGGTSPAPPDCGDGGDCSTKHCTSPAVCCDCTTVICTSPANCQRLCGLSPPRTRKPK